MQYHEPTSANTAVHNDYALEIGQDKIFSFLK